MNQKSIRITQSRAIMEMPRTKKAAKKKGFKKVTDYIIWCIEEANKNILDVKSINKKETIWSIFSHKCNEVIGYTTCPEDIQEKAHCTFTLCSREEYEKKN